MMEKYFITLLVVLWTSSSIFGQITVIEYDYKDLYPITDSPNSGDIMPISGSKSLINLGEAKLGILNNHTGDIVKFWNENMLDKIVDSLIQNNHLDTLIAFTEDERVKLPFCQRQKYIFDRFIKLSIPKQSDLYVCEAKIILKLKNNEVEFYIMPIVCFFNDELELVKIYERQEVYPPTLTSLVGAFFVGESNFYVKKATPNISEKSDFFHFELVDGIYKFKQELELTKSASRLNYFTGRFHALMKLRENYYLCNSTELVCTNNIDNEGELIDMGINEQQLMGTLCKVDEQTMSGLLLDLENDLCMYATLFTTENLFKYKRPIKRYDLIKFTINSMEVLENKAYLFLFDREKKKYILDIKPLK